MIRLWAGVTLVFAAWSISRTVARAWRSPRLWGWALDLAIPLIMFAAILAISARPLFAGVATFALIGGFAFADLGKRDVLHEPVVFTDQSELIELVRHPHLYLPFVGPGKVIAGALAAAMAFLALVVFEAPAWPLSVPLGLVAAAGVVGLVLGVATFGLAPAAHLMGRFRTTGDPVLDSAGLGALAMQFAHGIPARAMRPAIRAAGPAHPPLAVRGAGAPDIVLVQSESFFDARRLPGVAPDLLPGFARLKREGVQYGMMRTPTWGASTTRTEFEVLTGRPADTLGLDRFNPYHQLALKPLQSLASRLRDAGYRTVCVHPHDRRFYGRHRVMPCLGFDEFHGLEAFADAERTGRYVRDIEAARWTAARLAAGLPPLFIFVITMENHGPWRDEPEPPLTPRGDGPTALKAPGLGRYLSGLRGADALISPILEALQGRGDGVFGFYGDHMPGLALPGPPQHATDYAIWRYGRVAPAAHIDIDAHGLAEHLLAAADLLGPASPSAETVG